MSMTATQVKDLITSLWTRVGSNRVDDADLRTVGNAIVDLVAALEIEIFPDWTSGLTFQTDGTDDGRYCKYPDTDGKKRIFETKVDDNIGNAPPTDPLITETTEWKEISQSAKSGIVEWSAGVYGEGLIIVYWNHSTDDNNFYILKNPTRPFTSANIETEIVSGDWEKIPLKTEGHYRGLYTSLVNLESALPTANPGDFADVDPGSGTDLVRYAWDEDEGWVVVSAGGAVSGLTTGRIPFATSSSTLGDDADLSWDNINKVLVLGGPPSGGMSIFADYTSNRDNLILSDGMADWAGVLGLDNFGVGSGALYELTAGNHNHAIGAGAGGVLTIGEHNELIGRLAGSSLVNGSNNIIIGAYSDVGASSSGNVLLGYNQQGPTSGGQHVLIGYNVESVHPTASGELSIQNAIYGVNNTAGTTTLSTGNIGIYVQSPTARLHLVAGAAGAGKAPLKLTTGTALTTPEDGALEYHSSHLYFTIGSTRYQLDQQGGSSTLSGLTAATGTNTINNAGYAQEWQWNSLAGAVGLKLSSTSTAAASDAQALLEVNLSGANATSTQTTYAGRFINSHTGTGSTNVAGYFSASGGTNNYAGIFSAGYVGIGTTTPTVPLELKGGGTSTNKAFRITDSAGTEKLSLRDDGTTVFYTTYNLAGGKVQAYLFDQVNTNGNPSNGAFVRMAPDVRTSSGSASEWCNLSLDGFWYSGAAATQMTSELKIESSLSTWVAAYNAILFAPIHNISSGTGTSAQLNIKPTYNYTGTYAGNVYGIYYNPTLTSMTGVTHYSFKATSGLMELPASTTDRASFRILQGSAPTAPLDGEIWTTSAGLFVRINGSTIGPLS